MNRFKHYKSTVLLLLALCLTPLSLFAETEAELLPYLQETMEVQFTPELKTLATKLNHDPVELYNWVYENIRYENYIGSRKGAPSTLQTRAGNDWDQSSLLITLLRTSGIPARYRRMNFSDREPIPYVEAFVASGAGYGFATESDKEWVPLVPWLKETRVEPGINLFANGQIPEALRFDFDTYLNSDQQRTALELFEEQLQQWLTVNHPGKNLNDIPRKERIIKKPSSILPQTLPTALVDHRYSQTFASIENENRVARTVFLRRKSDDTLLLETTIQLPEVATSRLVLDFVPATEQDAQIIATHGSIVKTPAGAAQVKPVLKRDGAIYREGTPIPTGEEFVWQYDNYGDLKSRPAKKVGTLMIIRFDFLNLSSEYLTNLKAKLSNLSSELAHNDRTREEYLGVYGELLSTSFLTRHVEGMRKVDQLLHIKRDHTKTSGCHLLLYTNPENIPSGRDSKFEVHPAWNIDVSCSSARTINQYNNSGLLEFSSSSQLGRYAKDLYMYASSYNEGEIFEDWQNTPGAGTITTLMAAREQGIQVVTLTAADVVNGHLAILEQQATDQYGDGLIQQIIYRLLHENATIIIPVRKVHDKGMILTGYIQKTEDSTAYAFNGDHGGESDDEALEDFFSMEIDYTGEDGDMVKVSICIPDCNATPISDGDPVNMVSGEFYHKEAPDFLIKSRGYDLNLTRQYKSQSDYNGPFGYGWHWNHMDRIQKTNDGSLLYFHFGGRPHQFLPAANHQFSAPKGLTFSIEKTATGYRRINKNRSVFLFSTDGKLLSKQDRYGNTLGFAYDTKGRLQTITDAIGRSLTLTYNNHDKIVQVTDFIGRSTNYRYDGDDLTSFTDLERNSSRFEYLKNQKNPKNNHNLSKYILPDGDFLKLSYYKNDKVSHHTNKQGESFSFQYSPVNRYSETWSESGYHRKIFYNDRLDVVRINNRNRTIELREFDDNHNMIAHTDGNGNKTIYTYDGNRNLLGKTNALGETWRYEYDPRFNKIAKTTDPNGNTTTHSYDEKGNLIRMTDALGYMTRYEYDAHGNNIAIIDAYGNRTSNQYGADGIAPIIITDKNGNRIRFKYDAVGNVIVEERQQDSEFVSYVHEYNQHGQKTKTTDPLGNITTLSYNSDRQLIRTVLPNGAITENRYDIARDLVTKGNLIERINPLGNNTQFGYDERGNKIWLKDGKGNQTRFFYDEKNRLIEQVDPFQNSVRFTYDAGDNRIKEVRDLDDRVVTTAHEYDLVGRKIRTIDPEDSIIEFEYDKNGNLIRKSRFLKNSTISSSDSIEPDRSSAVIVEYGYDSMNRLITKIVGVGSGEERTWRYQYDRLGRKTLETDPVGTTISYDYDPNGNLTGKKVQLGNETFLTEFEYDQQNRLIAKKDGNGYWTRYEYDKAGQKITETNPLNHKKRYTWNNLGKLESITDEAGNTTKLYYDKAGQLIQSVDPVGNHKQFRYDLNGNQTTVIDEEGHETITYYDALSRKIGVENAKGATTTFDYDGMENPVFVTNPLGDTTEYSYDKNGNCIAEILRNGSETITTRYEYDRLGRMVSTIDPEGNRTDYTYNPFGEKISETNALNQIIQFEYDGRGRVTLQIDAAGVQTKWDYGIGNKPIRMHRAYGTPDQQTIYYEYDNLGNLTLEERGAGNNRIVKTWSYNALGLKVSESILLGAESITTTFAYDAKGRLSSVTDPKGGVTHYEYDPLDRQTAVIDASGNRTVMIYDKRGNQTGSQTPEGEWKFWEYDELRRNTALSIAGTRKEFLYDANNRLIQEIGFNRQVTELSYDALGRLIGQTEAKGGPEEATNRFEYDRNGNLTVIIDPRDNRASFEYDALNRKITETGKGVPYENRQRYEYDSVGNRTAWIKGDGKTVRYVHDSLGRLKMVKVNDRLEQEFEYDEFSRMKRAIDYNEGRGTQQVAYEYDSMNRVTAEIQNGKRINLSYDKNSNLFRLTYPSGEIVTRRYTATNRLRHVISSSLGTTADISRDKNGRVTTMMQANLTQSFSYDAKGREINRNYTTNGIKLYALKTEYDPEGNITGETITEDGNQQIRDYFYDKRNRLTKDQAKKQSWQYDRSGNWTFTNQNGVDEHRTVQGDSDNYSHIGGTINVAPTWSQATGNLLSLGNQRYEYDWKNRLVKVFDSNQLRAEYHYDALDRRVTKKVNPDSADSEITNFLYSGDQVIEEWQEDSPVRLYVYGSGIDDPIMQRSADRHYYFHVKNRQGSIVAMTDLSGNVIERYDYSAFGLLTITDAKGNPLEKSQIGNPFTFTGRRWDSESGLYHYRKRAYSPLLGRFLQKDPIGYLDGTNRYGYVHNNPLRYVDPMGLMAEDFDFMVPYRPFDELPDDLGTPVGIKIPIVTEVAADAGRYKTELTGGDDIDTDAPINIFGTPPKFNQDSSILDKMHGNYSGDGSELMAAARNLPLPYFSDAKRLYEIGKTLNRDDIPGWMRNNLRQEAAMIIGPTLLNRAGKMALGTVTSIDATIHGGASVRAATYKGISNGSVGSQFRSSRDSGNNTPPQLETRVISDPGRQLPGRDKTVWDSIKPTQETMKGTSIPKSFELESNGLKVWVHPNATKHMKEFLTRSDTTHNTSMNSQVMLTSFKSSVDTALKGKIKYDELIQVDRWELIFSKGRPGDKLPVIKHALYK